MKITFIGHGYVGLVTAAVFADLGNTVYVIGHTQEKIDNLKKGILPIYEPGLEELVKRNLDAGRLLFTLDYTPAISESSIVFIAVGTPPLPDGSADLSVVYETAKKVGENISHFTVVTVKSTVPVGTNKKVQELIHEVNPDADFAIASVPEFLREGQALGDTFHPDRIVIGTDEKRAEELMVELHQPLLDDPNNSTTLVLTNVPTAEMIKYAANAFLATKISFANAIAHLSEQTGSNGPEVLKAIGLDKRIGPAFLYAGAGYGGSCFPKDVKALIQIAKNHKYDFKLLKEVEEINEKAKEHVVKKAEKMLGDVSGKTIGVLGLAFKPDTDDMRFAPSLTVIPTLLKMGAVIKTYDPIAMENAKKLLPSQVTFCHDAYDVVKGADLVLLITEWNEFKELDFEKVKSLVKTPRILDARNALPTEELKKLGFTVSGIGR
jgi:UDPglucose 6-dehydrogenase